MHLSEEDFLSLLFRDKERAYHYLVSRYAEQIYNRCINTVRNVEDAEDLTQEVFTVVYLSLDQFQGKSKVSTWIYSIALNKSKEILRKKTRQKRSGLHIEIDKPDATFTPDQIINFDHPGVQLEDKELAKVLFSALDQLADNQRLAFTMHKIEGYSYDEIAEKLNVTTSSVESLMFRAKKNLQELLKNYFENF